MFFRGIRRDIRHLEREMFDLRMQVDAPDWPVAAEDLGEVRRLVWCSFCGLSQKKVKKLIAGPRVYICDECIDVCNEIIAEERARDEAKEPGVATDDEPATED